jgi:hypothetical protein
LERRTLLVREVGSRSSLVKYSVGRGYMSVVLSGFGVAFR